MSRPDTWRHDAAVAYLDTLRARGLGLVITGGALRIPTGRTPAEVALVTLLKAELATILQGEEVAGTPSPSPEPMALLHTDDERKAS